MNINKYIKQQDELVSSFTDGLTDNIAKSLLAKQNNFNLVISNQLTKLWNDSWNLGRDHAINETANFSYSNDIAEFADTSPLQQLGNEINKLNAEKSSYQSELIRIRRDYQDRSGEYNPTKILKSIDKKGTYTGLDKVRAIQIMINRENELVNLIAAKDNLINEKNKELDSLIRLGQLGQVKKETVNLPEQPRVNKVEVKQTIDKASRNRDAFNKKYRDDKGRLDVNKYRRLEGYAPEDTDAEILEEMNRVSRELDNEVNRNIELLKEDKPRKGISNREQRLIEQQLRKQQSLQQTKLDDKQIPKNIRDTVRAIESRRQYESTLGDVPLLEQTEFGKSYLNKRINTITNDLNNRYKDTLRFIVPEYLADNKRDKDVNYYRRISGMLTREDAKSIEQYQKQLDLIKTKLDAIPSKEIAQINVPSYLRQEFRDTKYNPEVKLTVANKQLLNELPDKATYTRKDIKSYRDKVLDKVRKIKDNQARTKRIALTEMGHAYNLGRLDYYVKQGYKFVKWNNSIEHKRAMIPGDYETRYRKIYNKLSDLINRTPQLESFKMDGIVCPICQERAIYDYGYGKGIIRIEDLVNNMQSQPLLHANCFPAGTEVSGIIPKTATRRYYQGNMIIIETASGLKLTVTPKHPILTNNGWISADSVMNGTYVFSAQNTNRLKTFIAPDYYQVPTLIEQVFTTFRKSSGSTTCTVPISTEDFHGDFGIGSKVNIVHTDSFLRSSVDANITKITTQDFFVDTIKSTNCFNSEGFFNQTILGNCSSGTSNMSINKFPVNFFLTQSGSKQYRSILDVSNLNVVSSENIIYSGSRNLKFFGNMINRFSRIEHLTNSIGINGIFSLAKAIYTPFFKSFDDNLNINSEILCNLFSGDSPVILADQVVNVINFYFSGHVYNLETAENWYTASNIIVHNCACFLTGLDKSEDKEPINVPIYISSLLNNNVVKWATAGILGTAAMYAAFKRSNLTPLNIPDKTRPNIVTTQQLSRALQDNIPVINVPLIPLNLPERVPKDVIIDRAITEVVEPIVNWRSNVIDNSINEATRIADKYELVNPYMVSSTKNKLDEITSRISQYKTITKPNLTKDILNQFKEDIDEIQYYINEIEDGNIKLYSSIQSMKVARKSIFDEVLSTLPDDLIPPGFTKEQMVIVNPTIQKLDTRIIDSENSLRNLMMLQVGETSHYSNLVGIRNELLNNELLKREYIKRKRGVLLRLQRNLIKQVLPQVLERDLNELTNTVLPNFNSITNEQFDSYIRRLDNIEFQIDTQLELIKNKLGFTSLDINYNLGKEGLAISTSEFIRDYKSGLIKAKRNAIQLRNLLLDVKLDVIP